MNPTCRTGLELLMDYLEGTLAADVHASLEHHVAGCGKCAAFVESYVRTPAILRAATDATLPPDVAQTLQARLRDRKQENDRV